MIDSRSASRGGVEGEQVLLVAEQRLGHAHPAELQKILLDNLTR